MPEADAPLSARLMVEANLTGHDTHGVRQTSRYVGLVAEGVIRAGAPIEVVRETPATAVLDAKGRVVARLKPFTVGSLESEAQGMAGETPYVRWGNWGILALMAACLLAAGGLQRFELRLAQRAELRHQRRLVGAGHLP